MVLRENLSSDPSNRLGENYLRAEGVNVIPVLASSDSEEEEISYEGYEVLPQEFIENNNMQPDDNDSRESSGDESNENIPSSVTNREISAFDQATKSELTELWNSTQSNRLTDIVMDRTKEEQIKNAMAGFKLPSTAIPQWAQQIPEEEWKEQLINRIYSLNERKLKIIEA